MKENLAIVEFANPNQLLKATLSLPEELGPSVDYWQGTAVFYAKMDQRVLPRMKFQIFDYDKSGEFNSSRYFVGNQGEPMADFNHALLGGGGIPELVEVSLTEGKDTLARFRKGLFPNHIAPRYFIDNAHFDNLKGEDWTIDELMLLTRGSKRYEAEQKRLQHPSERFPNPVNIVVQGGEKIDGWFGRLLEVGREKLQNHPPTTVDMAFGLSN